MLRPILTTASIRAKRPQLFQRVDLFLKVMAVLESHHFHHQMWSFAMNLFDRRVMRQIVLEEGGDEEEPYPSGKSSRQNGRASRASRSSQSEIGDYASIDDEYD
jgi:hypothetical protein